MSRVPYIRSVLVLPIDSLSMNTNTEGLVLGLFFENLSPRLVGQAILSPAYGGRWNKHSLKAAPHDTPHCYNAFSARSAPKRRKLWRQAPNLKLRGTTRP